MRERLGALVRRTGMRPATSLRLLGVAVALSFALAGCGDSGGAGPSGTSGSATPSDTSTWCRGDSLPRGQLTADLDGDGRPDSVGHETDSCGNWLVATVNGRQVVVPLPGDVPGVAPDLSAVQLPGRPGQLVLAKQSHPRGGFQAHLFGYADGKLAELTVDGRPIFPFVATDTTSDPISARCADGGFEVTEARAHTPIGIAPAWDVYRTAYTVDGNTVTKGPTTKVADNVLDRDLGKQYADLLQHALFENCRAGS